MSTARFNTVEKGVLAALGNVSVTLNGLVQLVHASHSDIKHVILVREASEMKHFTFAVRYHDRMMDTFSFARDSYAECKTH